MKKNLFKLILMTALCLMLCVAAMPFSVSAEETTTAAADAGATTAAATTAPTPIHLWAGLWRLRLNPRIAGCIPVPRPRQS